MNPKIELTPKQLQKLVDVLWSSEDCGPTGEGWPSPELEELRTLFDGILVRVIAEQESTARQGGQDAA